MHMSTRAFHSTPVYRKDTQVFFIVSSVVLLTPHPRKPYQNSYLYLVVTHVSEPYNRLRYTSMPYKNLSVFPIRFYAISYPQFVLIASKMAWDLLRIFSALVGLKSNIKIRLHVFLANCDFHVGTNFIFIHNIFSITIKKSRQIYGTPDFLLIDQSLSTYRSNLDYRCCKQILLHTKDFTSRQRCAQ